MARMNVGLVRAVAGRLGTAVSIFLAAPFGVSAPQPAPEAVTGVMAALERRLASGTLDDVQLGAACWSDEAYREVRVDGSGVGIWEGSAQFSATRDVIETMLQLFRDADFEQMPAVFGGTAEPGAEQLAPRIICQARLTVGPQTKEVVQLEKGPQSQELRALANTILDLCEARTESAITASSLEDGLAKMAAGQLASEALRLTIHHRTDQPAQRQSSGWVLRIDGRSATAEVYGGTPDSRQRVSLGLTASDLSDLVRTLQGEYAAMLPVNLYFPDYTDVNIAVLNHERQIQARQFSRMDPTSQAARREQFRRLLEALTDLHRHVLQHGLPAR